MGGSSKSSSASTTQNLQTTQSASGLVNSVALNASGNSAIYYTDQFGDNVRDMVQQLIDVAAGAGELAVKTVKEGYADALTKVTQAAQQASQPDLEVVKSQTNFVPFIVIAALATIAIVLRK